MFYLEHCFREAGAGPPGTVVIVDTGEETWASHDLEEEIRDLFPDVTVRTVSLDEPPPVCDLAVVTLPAAGRPLEDVVYRHLGELPRLLAPCRRARHVLVYRARWREAEIIPAAAIGRWLWRRRFEAWWNRRLRRIARRRAPAGTRR